MTARRISIVLTVAFVSFWAGLMGWTAVNNPNANTFRIQGSEATGNNQYPIAVVQATGSSWTTTNTSATTGTPGDAFASPGAIEQAQTFAEVYNGATWDRMRGSYTGTGPVANTGVLTAQIAAMSSAGNVQTLGTAQASNDTTAGGNLLGTGLYAFTGTTNWDRLRANEAGATTANRLSVATGAGVMTSLNAVAATGNGTSFNLGTTHKDFGFQVTTTGSPTTIAVQLQGSLDGANWSNIGNSQSAAGLYAVSPSAPCTWVRAQLNTLSGGSSPTVTVLVCAM